MSRLAKKYKDKLEEFQDKVRSSAEYWRTNYATFNNYKKYIYLSSLDKEALAALQITKKPNIECNVMEAYVSRLRGEFAKQMPSVKVSSSDGATPEDAAMVDNIEGHLRYELNENKHHGKAKYDIYSDMLTGGFSVGKVYTDYDDPRSFTQSIKFKKADDKKWPNENLEGVTFVRGESLSFSYTTNKNQKRLFVCEYYEKEKKEKKLLLLANDMTVWAEHLEDYNQWFVQNNPDQIPPSVVKDRKVEVNVIHFYRFIESKILEHRITDFPDFPLVFFDGNSVEIRGALHADTDKDTTAIGNLELHTRPYLWHAIGVQKFKNFALQCLANEFENMPQHKWMAPIEGMISDYKDAYINPQIPTTMIYRQFMEKDPTKQLKPPMAVQRPPIPPEIGAAIQMSDQMMQTILGSYDAALGINKNELSGIAVVEAATQSNAAGMPYIISFLSGLNSVANLILRLIPKYYTTSRTLPIIDKQGKRSYIEIGKKGFSYSENALHVKVEAGANFAIQKDKQMKVITGLMQALPTFARFIDQDGITILLENLEINGIDKIIASFEEWQKKQQQQPQQPDPNTMKAQNDARRIQMEEQQNQAQNKIKMLEMQLQNRELELEQARIMLDAKAKHNDQAVSALRSHAENVRSAVDLSMKGADMEHRHRKEEMETIGKVAESMRPIVKVGK
jgi:hypothetical protein